MTPRGRHKKINYTLNLNTYSPTSPIFDLKVSLDRVHQDINYCLGGYPPKGVRTRRAKKTFLARNIDLHYFTTTGIIELFSCFRHFVFQNL